MSDTVHCKNLKSGKTFDLPKETFEKLKEKEAGANIVEVAKSEKSDSIAPSAVAKPKQ